MITWKEILDFLDDGFVAGVSFSLACFTPVSNKLLYGGLEFVHVKRRGWTHRSGIFGLKETKITKSDRSSTRPVHASRHVASYPFTILHVLKHVEAVVNNGLQDLLVVFSTLADSAQV